MHNFLITKVKKQLIRGFSRRAGKNFFGRKTIFTQSGGLSLKYKIIDFKRNIINKYILLTIEKDLNRTGFIGLICFENGLFGYILLSLNNLFINKMFANFLNYFKSGSPTFLLNIPTGTLVHHIEQYPSSGGVYTKAAGTSSFIISRDLNYSYLKMNSGWLLKFSNYCIAIPGVVSNDTHYLLNLKKAGKIRQLGFRPTVRGISKNPCDHPHGGGEGRGSPPRAHRTPWGKLTKVPTKITKLFYKKKKLFKIFKKK